ncbi:hypothetical protein BH11MYX2_BH11MYX2_12310 [soil metagenome]
MLDQHGSAPTDHKLASKLVVAGLYGTFIAWTYFAWYQRSFHSFEVGGDGDWKLWSNSGWFSKQTYAGGADKMGHTWATMSLGRLGTEVLRMGGHGRWMSALVGNGLSELLFFGVEIGDGFQYTFSKGDFTFNTIGALIGFAQSAWPRVDELFDFRVAYLPSKAYRDRVREKSDLDIAEDYTGQTYLVSVHLGALPGLRDWRYGTWAKFVDASFGFKTRGYKPDPLYKIDENDPDRMDFKHSQTTFFGITLNAQGIVDYLLRDGKHETLRKVGHAGFEVFAIPGTTLDVVDHVAHPVGEVPDDQNL